MADNEKDIKEGERFQEQCFLIENWRKLSNINESVTKQEPYQNFIMLNGNPPLVVHELVGKKGIEDLFHISPAQLALLVPKIQIFKVKYSNPDKKSKPIDQEIVFRDHTSLKTIDNITKTRFGRGDDVGLKSFSYALRGENITQAGYSQCNLTFYLQNASSILAPAEDENTGRLYNLLVPEADYIDTNRTDPKTGKTIKGARVWNPKHFEIKIIAGWASPSDPNEILINKSLRKAIDRSSTVLLMTLHSENLRFDQNGSLEVSIDYNARGEALMADERADLLSPTAFLQVSKDLAKKASKEEKQQKAPTTDRLKARKWIIDNVLTSGDPKNKTEVAIGIRPTKAQQLSRESLFAESLDKQIRYSRLIKAIQGSSKMWFIDVDESSIKAFDKEQKEVLDKLKEKATLTDEDIIFYEKFIKENLRTQKINPKRTLPINVFKRFQEATAKINVSELELKKTSTILRKKTKEEVEKVVGEFEEFVSSDQPKECKECKRINFFYLGDLLDIALSVLNKKSLRVILGPITFIDPTNPNDTTPKTLNIADIPISLNLFLTWWLKKVVAPQRPTYHLASFLKDVLSSLVTPALGELCFLGLGQQINDISMNFFTVPGMGKDGEIEPIPSGIKERITIDDLINRRGTSANNEPFSYSTHKPTPQLFHYLYIYVSSSPNHGLKGNEKEDIDRGIYHLYTGADGGLVKKIEFERVSQPHVDAMRATQTSSESKRIQGLYNAKITMVGNNIFYPGAQIYIDTSRMGLDNPLAKGSLARELGLGGYYNVTGIEHSFDSHDYETTITAIWQYAEESGKQMKKPVERTKENIERFNKINKKIVASSKIEEKEKKEHSRRFWKILFTNRS